ncbi:MAG: hypothetical protein N2578_06200, partial [Bdellovibrionaceae bacterium]|nr:hypothetical protein [Pseudobdellovibrionaceae bacterium]
YIEVRFVISVVDASDPGLVNYTENATSCSENYGALCFLKLAKGDRKAYIVETVADDTFPSASSVSEIKFSRIRFFYNTTGSLSGITNGSDSFYIPVKAGSNPPLTDIRITGLENGLNYCFLMAGEDVTGNLFYFSNSGSVTAANHCVTPEEVVGLLDDKRCFIATAAYGSALEPEVLSLREFRDRYLNKSKWGRVFVAAYYRLSPPLAEFISDSPFLRALVRITLWPVVIFVRIILSGWGVVLLIASLALPLLVLELRRKRLQ